MTNRICVALAAAAIATAGTVGVTLGGVAATVAAAGSVDDTVTQVVASEVAGTTLVSSETASGSTVMMEHGSW
ncbi:hypothetical protein P5P86_13645 [Nocardioides sp. BP30]|uniref:hypothetical protein n=1 Tax=Nocardioides sp. BP30 TaxID=3036374 RepID=UPI002469B930|nr:hypothetical protein [Nocardioides sp. BP30]WGL51006.1 hypothetical protein P5P86_13645 [Nocardioides sp. BP30]